MPNFREYLNESKKSDYVYKNKNDTIRIRLFKTLSNEWDYDVFEKNKKEVKTFSAEAGDNFRTKKEALKDIETEYGKVKSIGNIDTVTQGW